jgi:hypothetical protein
MLKSERRNLSEELTESESLLGTFRTLGVTKEYFTLNSGPIAKALPTTSGKVSPKHSR